MRHRYLIAVIAVCLTVLFTPGRAFADGIIIPDPPVCDPSPCPPEPLPMEQLVIRYHHVDVKIEDQIATTHVDQVFYNPNNWQVEGEYVFPIPIDSAVSSFKLWVDGVPIDGEVLDADQARNMYEDIVRRMRDPALLEYAGQGAMRARIFPISPQGERRIELEYSQVLTAENGLVRYIYPLNTEKFSMLPLESVSVNIDVRAQVPIQAVYSPSHSVAITRESSLHVRAGYEDTQVLPDTDFALYYSLGEEQAFHLLSFLNPGDSSDSDGYFLALIAPQTETRIDRVPKDVILVLDRSGSMEGEKFRQAQDATRYILRSLYPEDRFNVISFSTGVERFASGLQPAARTGEAISWVERLGAQGSTDINRALLEAAALSDDERPLYLIFLTDGLPTEGVQDNRQILDNLAAVATSNLRLFAFGVGYDVDTFLLDSLAADHHGSSTYVLPGERLDETLSAFYAKISSPVLTDLELDFGDIPVYDLYPDPLPDLFVGTQIVVVGRYRAGGNGEVTLTGRIGTQMQRFTYPNVSFDRSTPENSTLAAIPRLWATRKVGYLLSLIRLRGPEAEIIEQIVRLSIRYGIVTPYTSYLVREEAPLGAAEQERIVEEQLLEAYDQANAPTSGQRAVEKAAGQGALADAETPVEIETSAQERLRIVGSRTFVYSDGVWVDTTFVPEEMQTGKIGFLTEGYFNLLRSKPDLAGALALGSRVIVVYEGRAIEVVESPVQNSLLPPQANATATPSIEPIATSAPFVQDPEVEPTDATSVTATQADEGTLTPGRLPCAFALIAPLALPIMLMFVDLSKRRV